MQKLYIYQAFTTILPCLSHSKRHFHKMLLAPHIGHLHTLPALTARNATPRHATLSRPIFATLTFVKRKSQAIPIHLPTYIRGTALTNPFTTLPIN